MENLKLFYGTCVDNPFDSLERLSNIIDGGQEINASEFIKNCDIQESDLLRDIIIYGEPSFTFYKYKNNNEYIYFYVWSAIEHFYY